MAEPMQLRCGWSNGKFVIMVTEGPTNAPKILHWIIMTEEEWAAVQKASLYRFKGEQDTIIPNHEQPR